MGCDAILMGKCILCAPFLQKEKDAKREKVRSIFNSDVMASLRGRQGLFVGAMQEDYYFIDLCARAREKDRVREQWLKTVTQLTDTRSLWKCDYNSFA